MNKQSAAKAERASTRQRTRATTTTSSQKPRTTSNTTSSNNDPLISQNPTTSISRTRHINQSAPSIDEQLAERVSKSLRIADPVPPQSGKSSTKRQPRSATVARKPVGIERHSTTVEDLASALSRNLRISGPKQEARLGSKGKEKQKAASNEEVDANTCLTTIRSALQTLSDAVQLGWTANKPTKDFTAKALKVATTSTLVPLRELRSSPLIKPIDIERTASQLVGRLISLEMFSEALSMLHEAHPFVLTLYKAFSNILTPDIHTTGLSLSHCAIKLQLAPPAHTTHNVDSTTLGLLGAFQLHCLQIALRFADDVILKDYMEGTNILSWSTFFTRDLPPQQCSALFTSAFQAVAKCKPAVLPRSLFQMRSWALRCLILATPLKEDSFWDQVGKYSASYVKVMGSEAYESVATMIDDLFVRAMERKDCAQFMRGKGFTAICGYRMKFARAANDSQNVARIKLLLKSAGDSLGGGESPEPVVDTDLRCAQLCANVSELVLIVEALSSDPQTDFSSLRLASFTIEECSRYASQQDVADNLREKIDYELEYLRRRCVHLLSTSGRSIVFEDNRSDDDLNQAGPSTPVARGAKVELSNTHYTVAITKLLLSLISYFTSSDRPIQYNHCLAVVDTRIALAKASVDKHSSLPSRASFDHLEHALSILHNMPSHIDGDSFLKHVDALRCLAALHWSFGGILYQKERFGTAVPHLLQSCEISIETLTLSSSEEPTPPSILTIRESLVEQVPKRWELLGYCEKQTGDRQRACDAFFQSIRCSKHHLSRLGEVANSFPPSLLFSSDPVFKNLESVVDKYSTLTIFDLLRPEKVSLLSALELGNDPLLISAMGALLEHQYIFTASCAASRSKEARAALDALMKDLLWVYDGDQFPIRRARVLLRHLESAYFENNIDAGMAVLIEIQKLLRFDIDYLPSTVERLALVQLVVSGTKDVGLLPFASQYIAQSFIWAALLAQRRFSSDKMINLISLHTSHAISILRTRLPKPPVLRIDEHPVLSDAQNKPSTKTRGSRGRVPPKTPKVSKGRPRSAVLPIPVSHAEPPAGLFDDFRRLQQHIGILCQILGLLNLSMIKIEVLHVHRALLQSAPSPSSNDIVSICTDLAVEYAALGRTDRANNMFDLALAEVERDGFNVSNEARLRLFVRYAEATVINGNMEQGLTAYAQAQDLNDLISEEPVASGPSKGLQRATTLEMAALAAHAFSSIQFSRGDHTNALGSLHRALRLWNRASDTLSRLNQLPSADPRNNRPPSPNPFQVTEVTVDDRAKRNNAVFDGAQWRVIDGTLSTLFALARTYFVRGSVRESEYFLEEARTLATSLEVPGMLTRAQVRLGELKWHSARASEANDHLQSALEGLSKHPSSDGADVTRIRANIYLQLEDLDSARQMIKNANEVLQNLEISFAEQECRSMDGPSEGPTVTREWLMMPSLVAAVMKQQIWLLRDTAGESPEYSQLLDRFLALPSTFQTKTEENILMGKLNLDEVFARFRADIVLSSLPESTVAVPMGMSGGEVFTPPTATRDLLTTLNTAEKFFWTCVELCADRGEVMLVREATTSLALIRAYQTALGVKTKNGSNVTAAALDLAIAPTLRRELIDCIDTKLLEGPLEDLNWRKVSATGSPLRVEPNKRRRGALLFQDSDDDEGDEDDASLKEYWRDVRERYRAESFDAVSLATSQIGLIPLNWTVVSITLTEDRSTLIVSRQRPDREPLIFYLPINRQDRREDSDEDRFSFDAAAEELQAIIRASDETTRNAVNISGKDERKSWWAERMALDKQLKMFVENMEFCWLGVFKTALCEAPSLSRDLLGTFRRRLEAVLRRNGCMHDKKDKQRLHLDDAILECFSTLSPKCRDEELEDLAYFVLDLFQLHGAQIAASEIDIDQLAIDIRTVLEEHAASLSKANSIPVDDQHLFLVLDKNVQALPWESIPVLRGRSISRIPSLSFLVDRIHLSRHLRGLPLSSKPDPLVDRAVVDPRKTFYILNPSGDLKHTQERFDGWLNGMRKIGWSGIVGRVPSEEELIRALTSHDLVIYFGHGGAEQYIRSHKIRNLTRCASTMLWGCSSGALHDMGDFDRIGNPHHYMVAGCPSLVANLWDVTDKDIDKVAQAVFLELGLEEAKLKSRKAGPPNAGTSIVTAVARSRDVCKLQYLTGAAPVVYGIPYYL